jgi:hypothetical protein
MRVLPLVVAALLCAPAAFAVLSPDALRVGQGWLRQDCAVGDRGQVIDVFNRSKADFEQFFLDALKSGPPADLLAQVDSASGRLFDLRQAALQSGKSLGLSPANLASVRQTTREQYVARERERFVNHYRSQAVAGLAIVAGPAGMAALRGLAADPRSPFQGIARESLARPR